MKKDNDLFRVSWTQPYSMWPLQVVLVQKTEEPEPEITDFAEAQEILARIMAK